MLPCAQWQFRRAIISQARRPVCVLALLICGITAYAKGPDWKPGKLVAVDTDGMSRRSSTTVITYRVEGGERVYSGMAMAKNLFKGVSLNAALEYAVDKAHLYIRDSFGKIHKLDLVKVSKKAQ